MKIFNISIFWFIKTISTFFLIIHVLSVLIIIENSIVPGIKQIIIGQFLAIFGVSLNLSHYYLLKVENNLLNKPIKLVNSKFLFKWIRHPMYLGELILMSGLLLLAPLLLSFLIFGIGFFSLIMQALYEDKELEAKFGQKFKTWKLTTGLLLPKINSN